MTALAVRTQCERVTAHVRAGGGCFRLHENRLDMCANQVVATTRRNYPDLNIPYHSRWRHFGSEGDVLLDRYLAHVAELDGIEAARVGFDLIIPSVLLDAGAGSAWSYLPEGSTERVGRSEGLGLASLAMFVAGDFACGDAPRSDAAALRQLSSEQLRSGFQVSDANPLVGENGRLAVLRSLGDAIAMRPDVFPNGRPGDLVDHFLATGALSAAAILEALLDVLSPIWPDRLELDGIRLGDAWVYEPFGDDVGAIVPFHKLSQWLTYSLVETLERSGIAVTGLERLTGLPEYRNGGLLYETGVISLRDPTLATSPQRPDSQVIVEWRALTVSLLDDVADRVRQQLDRPELLLAEILEGGTWATGRQLAFQRDPAGTPPITLDSDGTVF